MSCTVDDRNRVRRAADACGQRPNVAEVDVLAPDVGPYPVWTLEIVLQHDVVPTTVLQELAIEKLAMVDATTQGEQMVVTAIA